MRASTPHLRAANETQEKINALMGEVQDEHSTLSPEERATRRQEIDELWEQARREQDGFRSQMDELKARHPRWIK